MNAVPGLIGRRALLPLHLPMCVARIPVWQKIDGVRVKDLDFFGFSEFQKNRNLAHISTKLRQYSFKTAI